MYKKSFIEGNDAPCQICENSISTEEALRCSECDKVSHITCSGLPDYILVMYMITRNQYLCKQCVQQRKSTAGVTYDEGLAKIISFKEHETGVDRLSHGEVTTQKDSSRGGQMNCDGAGGDEDSVTNEMFHDVVSMEQLISQKPQNHTNK